VFVPGQQGQLPLVDAAFASTRRSVQFCNLVVEDKVIVEIKSVDLIAPVHKEQSLTSPALSTG
jgi:hypothetical protein